jgi:ATP-dependent helicase HrpB
VIPLPIDPLLPEIGSRLARSRALVLEAPPGAGKTTRVPPALLAAVPGEVLVLEPRRLAVRLAARRVASEMGERLGETVGYQVRFEDVSGPRTRLRFLTEGVLTRRLLRDPQLDGVSCVVLDEFHERHLDGDLALALLRRLQTSSKPDLRILVMSATLAGTDLGWSLVRSEGRLFPLAISYTPHSSSPIEEQVAAALDGLLRDGLDGDVLVFLPGAREIRRAARACESAARRAGLLVVPLHGDLSSEEQDRAVLPAPQRKLILSTNVAESSVTIEGVTAVIDSGLARVAEDSPWSGLPSLRIARVSRASAIQRAGRAGRLRPGRVVRLYSEEDFARRPERDAPEITRRELSEALLSLRAMKLSGFDALTWLDAPPVSSVAAAEELLGRLGALAPSGGLSEIGRRMSRYPLHPRLARLVLEADSRGAAEDGCRLAAVLSAGERLRPDSPAGPSDLLALLDADWEPPTRRVFDQIRRLVRPRVRAAHDDRALLLSVLAAFPDRVARRRERHDLLLAAGGSAVLSEDSVVRNQEFLVTVDIEERRERGLPLVRLASGIEPDWLLDLFPDRVTERESLEWNRASERVESASALLYDGLVIDETRARPAQGEAASRLLAAKAIEVGIARFTDADELNRFLDRVRFVSQHAALAPLGDEDIRAALESLCPDLASFAELEDRARRGLLAALRQRLGAAGARLLDVSAPERIRLPGGRAVKVEYPAGQPPWIASRLQDFFGMRETPQLAGVPVVVHLLAPNHRPVQMTSDLAGFWERLYPQVRRELMRRYPKHAWPERPNAG